MDGVDDPYTTLGVARTASQDEIRRAYRKLAKKHHPDLNPGDTKAEDHFKKISAANGLLSDADKRARFDRGEIDASGQERAAQPSYREHAQGDPGRRYSRTGASDQGWEGEDFADIFGTMFNQGRRHSANYQARGDDERYSLTTSFLDAVNGATRRLTLPDGRTLDVKIPAGTLDGLVMRLKGQGGRGLNDGPAGDAMIEIHVAPHPFFERVGQNVRLVLPVTLSEAVLGAAVEVRTPKGKVSMRIPAGSDSGTELRLRGRGVPATKNQEAGDLYATLRIFAGPPDPALADFLRTWSPETPVDPRRFMEDTP
uniref:DnaJ C-terminal domain-containing protein n=1 Tax=uncultured Sphingomonas sp. TaxID=158754 RepID=UPI0035CBCAF2